MGHWLSSLSLISYEERGFQQSGAWNSIPLWEADFFSYRSRGPAPGLAMSNHLLCDCNDFPSPDLSFFVSKGRGGWSLHITSHLSFQSSKSPPKAIPFSVPGSLELTSWSHPLGSSSSDFHLLLPGPPFFLAYANIFFPVCPAEYISLALHTFLSHLIPAYPSRS